MALRFRRSVKLIPGVRLNFGKRSVSVSTGIRGARATFGTRGTYGNVGIPGTGISLRSKVGARQRPVRGTRDIGTAKLQLELAEDGTVAVRDEHGNQLSQKYLKIAREQNPEIIDSWLEAHCEELNACVNAVLSIHLLTPHPDKEITFIPEPFDTPSPSEPQLKKMGLVGKLFRFKRTKIEHENRLAVEKYHDECKRWDLAKREWETEQQSKRYIIERGRFEDLESMANYLEVVLSEIDWPRETLVSIDVQEDGRKVMVDIDLPEIEEMPKKQAEISKNRLKLNIKDRSETQVRKDYMSHIHGIAFRVIGETFVHLPRADEVILSGFSQRLDKSTGNVSDEYLYSVRVKRSEWKAVNFKNLSLVDPIESLSRFELKRNMTKTGIFRPIQPFNA